MTTNLRMIRIQQKLDEIFSNKIDLSDITYSVKLPDEYYTRALAALAIVMRCGIDVDVAVQSITDGYHDMGIDAVFNDITQKKLFLVQSKWRKDGVGGISQKEAGTFVEGIKRIINVDFDGCNQKLETKKQDVTSALKDMEYQIEMIFCHTGNQNMTEYALRPVNDLLYQVNEDESVKLLVFSEIRNQFIYDYLANGQSGADINLNDVLLSNWGVIDTPFKAYYGTIPASAIGEWYKLYGNRLFAKNIRYYKGSTDVNQGMKDVLKNQPEKFFYYNNGIKILCKKILRKVAYSTDRTNGLFALEGISLVNGAQTTGAIGSVYMETPEAVCNARVFIQMIDLQAADEEQVVQITKLSNTQNRIEGKDFVSLDPQQERLRKELSFGGVQYLYKSGAKIDDMEHQISLDEAIIAQACLLDDLSIVALAKRNIGALTDNMEKAPYKLLFNGSTNSFSLYNAVLVFRAVESSLKNFEAVSTGRKKLVLIHGNRFLLYLVLARIKENKGFNEQYLNSDYVNDLVKSICQEYWNKVYDAMESHFADAYPAHIFKNVGRIKQIADAIN